MKKWRTIPQALNEVKSLDPDVALNERALRKMVKEGTISHMMNGRFILVDMNEVWGRTEIEEEK